MNVRFEDPFRGTITASNTSCGTITVTEQDTGGGGGSGGGGGDTGGSGGGTGGGGGDTGGSGGDTGGSGGMGGIGLPDDPAVLGGVGLLVVIIVALLVI